MRQLGTLKRWNDEKGFGFIEPDAGGRDIFVHIKAFHNRSRRPQTGERLSFEVRETDGKIQAALVVYNGEKTGPSKLKIIKNRSRIKAAVVSGLTLALIFTLAILRKIPQELILVYSVASLAAFLMYWHDKSAAQKGYWRTTENALLFFGLIGGWPDALAAQHLFRHKSSKKSFQIAFWLTVLLNLSMLGWLFAQSDRYPPFNLNHWLSFAGW